LLADLVAVQGDPIANISLLKKIHFVMKEGVVFKHDNPNKKTD
jgi:imidazolonepropionase-like amidohydrolase